MRNTLATLTALVLLVAGAPVQALNVAVGEGVDEVTDCMKANRPRLSAAQTVRMRTVDRTGSPRISGATIYWQKFGEDSKALIRFSAPEELRGSSLLLIQRGENADMFMYLPELRKTRRVSKRSLSGSMFGTDLSYEDFERFRGLAMDGQARRLPDREVEGRQVFVIEVRAPGGEESAYERLVFFVDQERCIPIQTELYEKGERLRKVMLMPWGEIRKQEESWVPHLVVVKDLVNKTQTEFMVDEIELDKKLPRKLFSESELASGSH